MAAVPTNLIVLKLVTYNSDRAKLGSDFRPFKGSGDTNPGCRISGLDQGCLTLFPPIKCSNIHVCSHALVVNSVYQGNLTGSLCHQGSMGLDIGCESFDNCAVMEKDAKIWETVKMYGTVAKTGFYGSQEAVVESDVTSISKGHED